MKKIYYLSAAMALLPALTSCLGDSKQEVTRTFSTQPLNIITNLEDGTTSLSSGGTYQFDLNITELKGSITTSGLVINNNSWNFTTEESYYMSGMNYANALFINPKGNINGDSSLPLRNSTFLGTPYFNYSTAFAGDYTFVPRDGYVLAASYNIGDKYLVKTFQTDTFFAGKTVTSYPFQGGTQTAENEEILYRIHLDTEKNKAVFIIYNAKFSGVPAEPVKEVIIVEDLDVEFSENGILITGENLVPEVGESNSTTPYPSFTFNNIRFETTNDILTECKISYQVAGIYNGEFTGQYVLEKLPDSSEAELD